MEIKAHKNYMELSVSDEERKLLADNEIDFDYLMDEITAKSSWRLWPDGNSAMHRFLGGITDGELSTLDHDEDDDGEITLEGRVFWHKAYQVQSITDVLIKHVSIRIAEST